VCMTSKVLGARFNPCFGGSSESTMAPDSMAGAGQLPVCSSVIKRHPFCFGKRLLQVSFVRVSLLCM
jgi:hypothetical protein